MYIVGYPRSGNTWLCYLLSYCLNSKYDDMDDPGIHPRGEEQRRYVKGGLAHRSWQSKVGEVLKTHNLEISNEREMPLVYLVRDGRDVMVSFYFYQRSFLNRAPSFRVKSILKMMLNKVGVLNRPEGINRSDFSEFVEKHASDWAKHVSTWMDRKPLVIVRYEDLINAPEDTLARVMCSLGVEVAPEVIRQALKVFSFSQLSKRQQGHEDGNSFFRKGVTGDWRNYFSKRDCEIFNLKAAKELEILGYKLF